MEVTTNRLSGEEMKLEHLTKYEYPHQKEGFIFIRETGITL